MAKLTLTDLINLSNDQTTIATINSNSAAIETALEQTLSRDGTAPNQMFADFDMNSNKIMNLPLPTTALEPVRKVEFDNVVANIGDAANNAAIAQAAAISAAASFDSFHDRYLGAKTSDPLLDNDGNPILIGALYFNFTTSQMRVYNLGNFWSNVYDRTITMGVLFDGGGSVLTTGTKRDLTVPFSGQILSWRLLADVAGSCIIDIWKDTFSNYPPTIADVITASAKPTLSGVDHAESSTLTGWTTTFAAGDTFRFNVNSATTVKVVTLALTVLKSIT